jgi:hypothetical protein
MNLLCSTYRDSPFDSGWTQTYKVWEINHWAMYNMMLNMCDQRLLAADLGVHKKTCDDLVKS